MRLHLTTAAAAAGLMMSFVSAYDECVSNFNANKNYFPAISRALNYPHYSDNSFAVQDAKLFDISYFDTYKVVNSLKQKMQYVLYVCGGTEPDVSSITLPTGYGRKFFSIPVQKFASDDSPTLYSLMNLDEDLHDDSGPGVSDRAVSMTQYVVHPCLQKAASCTAGSNKWSSDVAATFSGTGSAPVTNAVSNNSDVIFTNYYSADYPGTYVNTAKFVVASPEQEHTLLGRSEWIKFFGAFFNKEREASRLYRKIKNNFQTVSAAAKAEATRPVVAFISAYNYGTQTYTINTAQIYVSAVEEAGGRIKSREEYSVSSDGMKLEYTGYAGFVAWKAALADVDIAIDESYLGAGATLAQTLTNLNLTSTETDLPFIVNQKLFREDMTYAGYATTWYEAAYLRADLFLKDFVKAIHPDLEEVSHYTRYFLRDMFQNEAQTEVLPTECTKNYAICDTTVSTYPLTSICPVDTYKKCPEDTAAFLTPGSGCTKMASCHAKFSLPGTIALGVLLPAAFLMGAFFFLWRRRSAAHANFSSPGPQGAAGSNVRAIA